MNDTLQVFAAGLGGVFIGMLVLYIAIRLIGTVVEGFSKGDPNGE
jgi:hypothetical protein